MRIERIREIVQERRRDSTPPVLKAFDAAATSYDQSRRGLIPDYDAFYGAAMACLPPDRRLPLRILDIGSGTGAFAKMIGDAYPHARIIVSDASDGMLDEARQKLERDVRYEFRRLDALIDPLPSDMDVIVSSLVIHHFDHADKRALFRRIHAALKPGGVFVNADQASTGRADEDRARFDAWLTAVKASGMVKQRELREALERMEAHDQNAPVGVQSRWLEETGFRQVGMVYFNYMWAVFVAAK